eukprot:ANDGO_07930.mRNA.1 Hybrid signal transduction histidine kinase B
MKPKPWPDAGCCRHVVLWRTFQFFEWLTRPASHVDDAFLRRKCRTVMTVSILFVAIGILAAGFSCCLLPVLLYAAFSVLNVVVFFISKLGYVLPSEYLWVLSVIFIPTSFVISLYAQDNDYPSDYWRRREEEQVSRTFVFPLIMSAFLFGSRGLWCTFSIILLEVIIFYATNVMLFQSSLSLMFLLLLIALVLTGFSGLRYVERQQLLREKSNFDALFQASVDPLVVHFEGRIIRVNDTFLRTFNVRREDVEGCPINKYLSPLISKGAGDSPSEGVVESADFSSLLESMLDASREQPGSKSSTLESPNGTQHAGNDLECLDPESSRSNDDVRLQKGDVRSSREIVTEPVELRVDCTAFPSQTGGESSARRFVAMSVSREIPYLCPPDTMDAARIDKGFQQRIVSLTAVRDQTMLLEAERASREIAFEKAKSAAMRDLVHSLTHELRTPLWAVIASSELLVHDAEKMDPDHVELVETILKSSNILFVLINDLLDRGKLEAGNLSLSHVDFELCNVIEDAVDMLKSNALEHSVSITSFVSRSCPQVLRGDPIRVKQIVWNLLSNAIKFTKRNGSISVRCAARAVPRTGMNSQTSTQYEIVIEVIDTGIGIPQNRLDEMHSFQKWAQFSSTQAQHDSRTAGSGLGLFICNSLVRLMDGYMEIESKLGVGSTFRVFVNIDSVENPEFDTVFSPTQMEDPVHILLEKAPRSFMLLDETEAELGPLIEFERNAAEYLADLGLPQVECFVFSREKLKHNVGAGLLNSSSTDLCVSLWKQLCDSSSPTLSLLTTSTFTSASAAASAASASASSNSAAPYAHGTAYCPPTFLIVSDASYRFLRTMSPALFRYSPLTCMVLLPVSRRIRTTYDPLAINGTTLGTSQEAAIVRLSVPVRRCDVYRAVRICQERAVATQEPSPRRLSVESIQLSVSNEEMLCQTSSDSDSRTSDAYGDGDGGGDFGGRKEKLVRFSLRRDSAVPSSTTSPQNTFTSDPDLTGHDAYFPLSHSSVTSEASSSSQVTVGEHAVVLLADDDRISRRVTAQLLKRDSFSCHEMVDGWDALIWMAQSAAANLYILGKCGVLPDAQGVELESTLEQMLQTLLSRLRSVSSLSSEDIAVPKWSALSKFRTKITPDVKKDAAESFLNSGLASSGSQSDLLDYELSVSRALRRFFGADVVLLDQNMPLMGGTAVVQTIRALENEIFPVIQTYLSSNPQFSHLSVERCKVLKFSADHSGSFDDFNALVLKPCKKNDLLSLVSKWTAERIPFL